MIPSCARRWVVTVPRTSGRGSRRRGWRTSSSGLREAPRAMRVLHIHKLRGVSGSENHLLALLPALREQGVDARFLGLDVSGLGRAALLRTARRAGRPVPLRPLRRRRQPADGARHRRVPSVLRPGPHPHAPRPRRHLRRDRRAAPPDSLRVDPAQRRPLSARPIPLRRPHLRARRTPADRDLGRRPAISRRGGTRSREADDDPLRARRAAARALRADAGRRAGSRARRRSRSRSGG